MRNTFVRTLLGEAKNHPEIYIIAGDLGYGVLTEFWEKYPEQFLNAGIAEQNMTLVAAGLAFEGKHPYTYSIANFTTMRCLEQIRNDVAYHNIPVTIVSVGAGFAYGGLGMSHHATEDLAIMRVLPNFTVYTPCDPAETVAVTLHSIQNPSPSYIRLGKGGEKNLHFDHSKNISPLKANVLCTGNDVVILVAGAIASEAVAASQILQDKGIGCEVWSFPTIKPIDSEIILYLASKYKMIFTLEEHSVIGGFASAVSEVITSEGCPTKLVKFGLQNQFTSVVGSQNYLREYYQMNASSISKKIEIELA